MVLKADPREEMLLELLAESSGEVVSGEVMSGKLGLEPSEVYRLVDGLRARGYRIDTVTGGYRLMAVPDRISPLELGTFLTTREIGRTLHYRESVPSTNEVALRLAGEGAFHGEVVAAEHQTMGRGRSGRRWISPMRQNLYFSVVLRPSIPAVRASELTLVGAVAVAHTIREAFGLPVGIKWPNDIQIEGKKLAGLLTELHTENDSVEFVVLGIGLNVNMNLGDIPPEIASCATSLKAETGGPVNRPLLLAALLSSIEEWYERWLEDGFEIVREEWLAMNVTVGRRVHVVMPRGDQLSGEAVGLEEDGSLLLKLSDGSTERVYSGEVVSAQLGDIPGGE